MDEFLDCRGPKKFSNQCSPTRIDLLLRLIIPPGLKLVAIRSRLFVGIFEMASSLISKYGKTALITGASSGIGAAFATTLAQKGFDLILVARRLDRLTALQSELSTKHRVNIFPIAADLQTREGCATVFDGVQKLDITPTLLVNNAGYGTLGEVCKNNTERELGMIDLNCRAVVDLTQRFVPAMKTAKRGGVIIVSSVVGALPAPWFATYAATKSFDLYFGEALHGELKGSGVDVLTVLPGLTRTEFQASAGSRDYHSPYREAQDVVNSALGAIGRKAIVVDGWSNKCIVHGSRFLPRALVLAVTRRVMKYEMRNLIG